MHSLKLLVSAVFLLTSISGAALAARDTHKHNSRNTTQQTTPKHGGKSPKGRNSVTAPSQKHSRKNQH
jgi:hypothetical protein